MRQLCNVYVKKRQNFLMVKPEAVRNVTEVEKLQTIPPRSLSDLKVG